VPCCCRGASPQADDADTPTDARATARMRRVGSAEAARLLRSARGCSNLISRPALSSTLHVPLAARDDGPLPAIRGRSATWPETYAALQPRWAFALSRSVASRRGGRDRKR
jgi:hypothetical protein